MAQLRHLSDDVFKSVALFLGLNVLIFGAVIPLTILGTHGASRLCALVSVAGIALTLAAHFMLRRHRVYYLEMLAKKSLLEMQLGFYDRKFAGSEADFALPWRLKPEVVSQISKNFDGWVQKSIRSKGTMARVYFRIYETIHVLYAASLLLSLWRMFR